MRTMKSKQPDWSEARRSNVSSCMPVGTLPLPTLQMPRPGQIQNIFVGHSFREVFIQLVVNFENVSAFQTCCGGGFRYSIAESPPETIPNSESWPPMLKHWSANIFHLKRVFLQGELTVVFSKSVFILLPTIYVEQMENTKKPTRRRHKQLTLAQRRAVIKLSEENVRFCS